MNRKLLFFIVFLFLFSLTACQNQDQNETIDKEVVITFNANNSQTVETRVFSNQILNFLPDDPTKDGYLFDGWYTDQDLNQPFDPKLLTYNSEDLTVYAKWIQIKKTISFETNSNNIVQPIQIEPNKPIFLPSGLEKDGYNFFGWYLDEELTIPLEIDLMPDDDLTLYAKWTESMFYYDVINEEAIITGIIPQAADEHIFIPDMIDAYPVVSITYEAFEGYSDILSIVLPKTIEALPLGVFHDQINLYSLSTPFLGISRYQEINNQEYYFYLLGSMFINRENQTILYGDLVQIYQSSIPYSLRALEISDSEIIPTHALSYTRLQELYFGETTETIKALALYESNYITALSIPESVQTIEPGAFTQMENLYYFFVSPTNNYFSTNELSNMLLNKDQTELYAFGNGESNIFAEIPSTVTYIHSYAFANSSIFSIIIPQSVEIIDDYAFFNCNRLSTLTFEENSQLTTIGDFAFSNNNIISLTIPNQVTHIKSFAFERNYSLEILIFESGSNVSSIGYQAFARNYGLTSVILPISLEHVSSYIFYSNQHLIIYVEASEKPSGWAYDWSTSIDEEHIIWGYVED